MKLKQNKSTIFKKTAPNKSFEPITLETKKTILNSFGPFFELDQELEEFFNSSSKQDQQTSITVKNGLGNSVLPLAAFFETRDLSDPHENYQSHAHSCSIKSGNFS